MRKKLQLRGFFTGVLACVLVAGLIGTAAATVGRKSVNVDYKDIKVTMNGQKVNLVDSEGIPVEPFLINGTTYLPVRAVATALGLDVGWDGATSTVKLTTKLATPTGTLIMDKNDIKVYYNGISESSNYSGGYDIKLTVENNSEEQCDIYVEDFSAKGIMVDESFSCKVAAGKKANSTIRIYQSSLEEAGIDGPLTDVEFFFRVCDQNGAFLFTRFDSDIIKL